MLLPNLRAMRLVVILMLFIDAVSMIWNQKIQHQNFQLFLKETVILIKKCESNPVSDFCNFTTSLTNVKEGIMVNSNGMIFQDMNKFSVSIRHSMNFNYSN